MKIDPYLSTCTKLKSKWIKDLNISPNTLNLIEENVEPTLQHMGTGDHFLHITPATQTLRASLNKWELLRLNSFCKAKESVSRQKDNPLTWRRPSPNPELTMV